MNIKKWVVLICGLWLNLPFAVSQDEFKWWEKKHNWDGVSDYTKYLTYSPLFFGPNALAIPQVSRAEIENKTRLESSIYFHRTKGDNTNNLFNSVYIPIGNRVALEGYVNSIEQYEMDTVLRDLRAARDVNPKGIIGGDIYLITHLLMVKELENRPAVGLRIGLRTASGLHLKNARYTDAPGYFFDFSLGKNVEFSQFLKVRLYGMFGFYAWQTNLANYQQNDAILFGLGSSWSLKKVFVNVHFSGYQGYLNNGDKPRNLSIELGKKTEKLAISLEVKKGFIDNIYNTLGIRFFYFLPPVNN